MNRRVISALLLIVMLISLVPAQTFATEALEDDSGVLTNVEDVDTAKATETTPSEDEIPGEEVEILPIPEAEYEEITEEESSEEPETEPTENLEAPNEAENGETEDETEDADEADKAESKEAEESEEKVSVRFNLTPADLTLKVYPTVDADSAKTQETSAEEPRADDELAVTEIYEEIDTAASLGESLAASEPQPISPEEDGSYLLIPGEYYYDAECEGYIPTLGVAFTVTESAVIDVVLEEDSVVSVMGTDTSVEYPITGTCGDNLTWSLDEDGVLTISGEGMMYNYSYGSSYFSTAPWKEYQSIITIAEIESGVTSIGNYAFYNCSSLTSVTIPNSVTSIGDFSFYNCRSLTGATIPDGVTSIGKYAFYWCSSLTSVTIPNSVTSIGDYAFPYCSKLTSVTLGNSVTSIGNGAFRACSLTSVTIPDSVTSIGDRAFSCCYNLTSVTIPSSVTEIDTYAFFLCSSLANVYYSGTKAQWDAITIGSGNDPLTSATIHYGAAADEYTYIIKFNKGNSKATGTMSQKAVKTGSGESLPKCAFKLTGKQFAGWKVSGSSEDMLVADGEKLGETLDALVNNDKQIITLTAVWETAKYTITYDANGGTDAPEAQEKTYGNTIKLTSDVPTRKSAKFKGWATSKANADKGTVKYKSGAKYTQNSSITLYAVWDIPRYAVKFNANGGSRAPKTQSKEADTDLTLSETIPTRNGYVFVGWADNKKASAAQYTAGDVYTENKAITLYAVWRNPKYRIEFILENSCISYVDLDYRESYTIPELNITGRGRRVIGWNTKSARAKKP